MKDNNEEYVYFTGKTMNEMSVVQLSDCAVDFNERLKVASSVEIPVLLKAQTDILAELNKTIKILAKIEAKRKGDK